ncbi:hypothetical protein HNO52_07270 [Billgrantia diversa]|uniref:hypothetical protein n=1 Tax=Halomonas sp. MCCC 1A13316 TaxID=2733487 RepID=UPI0018A488EB|nr:hypothetical protein [Halomonas sp. MCCC 1A13316]QOR38326.1 hypothetical protein HNO52_07270 [Halomonas sp. MCCC 1A13316]
MTDYHIKRVTAHRGGNAAGAIRCLGFLALALVLSACTAPRPGADLPPYGDTVRHTREIQTYEPGDAVPPLHGAKAAEAMRTYRLPPAGAPLAPGAMQ